MEAIPEITNIPKVTTQVKKIVEINTMPDGKDKISNKYYEETLYDHYGRVYVSKNMYTINYLV